MIKASTPEKSYGKFDGVLNIIENWSFSGIHRKCFYQSARESVNMIKNVIPFMVFLALMNGIIEVALATLSQYYLN